MTDAAPAVIVYTRPNCGPCRATKRVLDSLGVAYEERAAAALTADALAAFKRAGFVTAPIVVTRDAGSWAGHQPARLAALAKD